MKQELPNEIQETVDRLFPVEGVARTAAIRIAQESFRAGFDLTDETKIIPPNPEALTVVRLFLEKHEALSADERKEILTVIKYLNAPMLLVKPGVQR